MKVLSNAEVEKWFSTFPKNDEYVHCDERGLFFTHPEANCIDIEYPPKVERLPFLARYLSAIGYEIGDFSGAMIWFTEWGVWNDLDEGPGYRIVEAIRAAAGQPMSFEAAAGQRFRADELDQAIGLLLQPMVFGWDAVYYPNWSYGTGQFFLHVSHDSFVSVVTRTKEFYERVFAQLKELNLNPMPGHEPRVHRFCRKP